MIQEKIWHLQEANPEIVRHLQNVLSINQKLCELLALRGINNFDEAKLFFRPGLEHLHDPFMMKGMKEAVERIEKAIQEKEKVMLYGDYDVDGTSSVALLYSFLSHNFPELSLVYHLPHRYKEGYGLSIQGIEEAARLGCQLIITIDCGIKAIEQAQLVREKGIDLIVCDHHLPGETLPIATAILNPKQAGCTYPYKELCGCGIGFKLITALSITFQLSSQSHEQYLDLVALATAADIVPMTGENRLLTSLGLDKINQDPSLAFQKLRQVACFEGDFTVSNLVFVIAPRINAAGRMNDAKEALKLLIETDFKKAEIQAQRIQDFNQDRKEEEKQTAVEALTILETEAAKGHQYSSVAFQPHWHKGVIGIVASRLQDNFYRPTIVLTEEKGEITGSARSVAGFNIYEALQECAPYLKRFGGHKFAAGMTLLPENLVPFKTAFEQTVAKTISEAAQRPQIIIDAALDFKDITWGFYNILAQFEPCGPENLTPIFITRGLRDTQCRSRIIKDRHLRVFASQEDGLSFSGIGFDLAPLFSVLENGALFDLVYQIEKNEWQEQKSLQLRILDLKPSAE